MAGLSRFTERNRRHRRVCHSHIQIHNVVSDSEHESESEDFLDSLYDSDYEDCSDRSSQPAVNRSTSASPTPRSVQSLSSLAAQVTGEHFPCQFLENHNPPLDEAMIKKVAFWAFPQSESRVKIYAKLTHYKEDDWRDGESLIEEDRIMDITQVGFMVSAILSKTVFLTAESSDSTTITTKSKIEDAKVMLSFEKHKVTSTSCSLCPQVVWCRHVVAVIIYRIRNANKITVHAPVTEVLGTLSRDQMQKLLQYAIREDPGGVTCHIFKHMDKIRDTRSELNQTQGAPDPTFGICEGQESCIDLSLEQLNHDFRDDVKRVSSYRYPDTCNFDEKAKSQIYRFYIQKVAELIANEEVDSAGKVLIKMANTTLNEITTQRQSVSVNRLFHDIERLFSCFISSFQGQIRADLIQTAIDINSITKNMDSDRFINASEWSDLDSIPLENYITESSMSCEDGNSQGILGASRTAPFYQAVCSSLISDPPDSLEDLLNGNQRPLTTSYEEPLPVMLLRFETLMHFGTKKVDQKLYYLGVVILRKLLNLSRKYSVIGCNKVLDSDSEASSSENDDSDNESVSSLTSMKRTRKQKNRPKKKPCSVPRLDTTEVDMEGMSRAQISYSLLFVCYTLYKVENLVSLGLEGFPVILDATFRAMELGRFRAIASEDAIVAKDYCWLVYLDKQIQESYSKLADNNSTIHTLQEQTVQKYASALQEHQASFYGDNYAVGLLSLLLHESLISEKVGQTLALEGACLSTRPLRLLNIPELPFNKSNAEDLKSRWKFVIEKIFSGFLDNKTNNNALISKFLTYTESIDDIEFAFLVYQVLSKYQKEFTLLEQQIAFFKFLLQLVKLCNSYTFEVLGLRSMLCTSFIDVGVQIQTEFLGLILPDWQEMCTLFSTEDLKKIIKVMEGYMYKKGVEALPRETTDMLLRYFEAGFKHDEECSEFLRFLPFGALRQDALQKVIYNNMNYTPTALLLLAKITHDEMDSSTLPFGDLFSENVFLLIQQAFRRLREPNNGNDAIADTDTAFSVDLRVHLLWFFGKIAECGYGDDIVKGSQFPTIMDDIATTIRNDSQLLVSFFSEMKKSEPLFDHARHVLGEHLIGSYQRRFQSRLRTCGRCSYEYVLQEMKEARNNCMQYVDNGGALFKRNVTEHVRRLHRGKKKFLQLMDSKFPELRKDF